MKASFFVFPLFLALVLSSSQAARAQSAPLPVSNCTTVVTPAGVAADGLTLSASTGAKAYVGGEAIILKIALDNFTSSNHSRIVMGSSAPLDLFDFDVTYADQGRTAFTAFGQRRLRRVPYKDYALSITSLTVPPGKAITYQVVISRLFDMSRGGTYWITLRWHDPMADTLGKSDKGRLPALVSNQAVVRVEEPVTDFYGETNFIRH